MTTDQALAVCAALTTPTAKGAEDYLVRSRHALLSMIRSGPLKSPDRAARALSRLLQRFSVATLVERVREEWKTQSTWEV